MNLEKIYDAVIDMLVDDTHKAIKDRKKHIIKLSSTPEKLKNNDDKITHNGMVCFHSRWMRLDSRRGLQDYDGDVIYIDTAELHTGDTDIYTSDKFQSWLQLIDEHRHIHVVWDGKDHVIPMIVGAAAMRKANITSGQVNNNRGHKSRIHEIISAFPSVSAG